MLVDAKIGFAEAYMHGDFDATPSLESLVSLLLKNESALKARGSTVNRCVQLLVCAVQYAGR
jgi:hypothetical protein